MSSKRAVTEFPVHDLIAERWSPRAFSDRKVGATELRQLFEAARWGASCFGEQPWRFIVAPKDDAEGHAKLASCLVAGNAWAKDAPVLALSVASTTFTQNGKPNRWSGHDVGLAMGNLSLQAQSMGIYIHQMGGFDVTKAHEALGIPQGFEPMAMIAIGYMGDPATLSEDMAKREVAARIRKPQSEFVFGAAWGEEPKL